MNPKPPTYPSGFTKALQQSKSSDFLPETKIAKNAPSPLPPDVSVPVVMPDTNHAPSVKPPFVIPSATVKRR